MNESAPPPSGFPRPLAPARAPRRAVAFLAAMAVALLPAAASAQIAEAWLHGTPISTDARPFSARLEAMGNLSLAVEEDQTRINAFDYSGNPAGLFADQDSSVLEQYTRYDRARLQYFDALQSAQLRRSGARVVVKHGDDWSLGIDAIYRQFRSNQHDDCPGPDGCRFIRDFDLPYPGDIIGVAGDRAIGAVVEAPLLLATYSRPLFLRGLTVGGRLGYANEAETRSVPIRYPLNHNLNSYHLEGGALYDLRSGELRATVGGHAGWASDRLAGSSQGPLNDDRYDWKRPSVWFGAQAVIRHGAWMRGIVDVRHRSFDGEQVALINWAPQFYLNPLPSDNQEYNVFKVRWSALLSGLRRNEYGTRWLLDVKGTPLHAGAGWRYYREYEWLRPNEFVLTAGRELDVRRLGYTAGAGVAADFPDQRGLVAVEFHYARDHRLDFTGEFPEIGSEQLSYHVGAEYRPVAWLPVRGGLVALRDDPDRRDGDLPVRGLRLSAGTGYDWAWLRTHLDLAWAHEHVASVPGGVSGEMRSGDTVSLAARYAF